MTTTPPTPRPDASPAKPGRRRPSLLAKENRRLLYGLIIGAVTAAFAIANLDTVDVNWLFGTWETPLIVVIAVAFLLGAAAGWIAAAARRKKSRD
jgi:uncharacterized integral membrane protein